MSQSCRSHGFRPANGPRPAAAGPISKSRGCLRINAAYSKVLESSIRRLSRDVGRNLLVAPIIVDVLEGYSRRHGLDPNTAEARAHFAAEVTRLGQTLDWPPRRSEPCWCGSGLKYKRCCATAPDDRV